VAIAVVKDYIGGLWDQFHGMVVAQGKVDFLAEGLRKKNKPESYTGEEEGTTAKIIIGHRKSNQPLDEIEQELLTANGIPFLKETVVEDCFVFNPELSARIKADEKLANEISKALSKVKGLGLNSIQHQVGQYKYVVTDDSLNAMYRADPAVAQSLQDLLIGVSVRPSKGDLSTTAAIEHVLKLSVVTPSSKKWKNGS